MLTKTSMSASRTLTYLGLHSDGGPYSPRYLAQRLGESPTYLTGLGLCMWLRVCAWRYRLTAITGN